MWIRIIGIYSDLLDDERQSLLFDSAIGKVEKIKLNKSKEMKETSGRERKEAEEKERKKQLYFSVSKIN